MKKFFNLSLILFSLFLFSCSSDSEEQFAHENIETKAGYCVSEYDAYWYAYDRAQPIYDYWSAPLGDHMLTTKYDSNSYYAYTGVKGYGIQENLCKEEKELFAAYITSLHVYWNPKTNDHFYTINPSNTFLNNGYSYGGVLCDVFKQHAVETVPVYVYWHSKGYDHFYTTVRDDAAQRKNGYEYNGIGFYVLPKQLFDF